MSSTTTIPALPFPLSDEEAEKYSAYCQHCNNHKDEHVDGKCLFAPTIFRPALVKLAAYVWRLNDE